MIYFDQLHSENILQQLWLQCQKEEFYDVVLIGGTEKKRIPAHRCILSAASKYFNGMFQSMMSESKSKEIELYSLDADILQKLVLYCYTGRVAISDEIVVELLETADMLLLSNVVKACENFLIENLHTSNCLGFMLLAERYNCERLFRFARDHSLEHFMELQQTEEFLELNSEQLGKLLACDDLSIKSEEDVFQSLMTWIRHDQIEREKYLDELLKLVRLSLLHPTFLLEYVKPICTSVQSLKIYTKASSSKLIKPRKSNELLMAIVQRDALLYYCPLKLEWLRWSKNFEYRSEFGVAVLEHYLFIVGGEDDEGNILNTIQCLNLQTMKLRKISPMKERRARCRAAVLNGFLYAVGGENGTIELSSVERWDPKANSWSEVASMSISRWDFGLTVLQNKLYAVGGSSNYNVLNTAEYYDPERNIWTTTAPMSEHRQLPTVSSADKGLLYVVGGVGDKSAECYNPATNCWTTICDIPEQLSSSYSSTGFRDKVVVCYNDRVVEYNKDSDEWETNAYLQGLVTTGEIFSYSDQLLTANFFKN